MKVKLLKDTPFRKAGEVIDVDSASAESLIRRGKAENVADGAEVESVERGGARRGNVAVVQVADADPYPGGTRAPAVEDGDQEPDVSTGDDEVASRVKELMKKTKAELVALAGMTEAEAADVTKEELAEHLARRPQ